MTDTLTSLSWSEDLATLGRRFGDSVAVTGPRDSLSYRQLARRAHGLAAQLLERGIVVGQPIAVHLPNGGPVVAASYGVMLAGAAEVPLSWSYSEAELRWQAELIGFGTVITLGSRAAMFEAMGLAVMSVEALERLESEALLPPVPADVWGRVLSTSGTTGRPKGMVYTHGRRWIGNTLLKSTLAFTPEPTDRIALMTPFAYGASLLTFAWLDYGAEVLLLEGVDVERLEPRLEAGEIDAIFAPPTVIAKLAEIFGARRFEGVRCVFTGTAPLTPALYGAAERMFGPVVRITYGKTECTNPITVLLPRDTAERYTEVASGACVGWAAPGVELRICAEDDTPLPAGEMGEVWLRASQMANGQIDAGGFRAFGPQDWHRTGDLGHLDARGRLWLDGRLADVIKTGGYKVSPDEIERVLAEAGAPPIVVTSLPSAYWGEIIVAASEDVGTAWVERARARVAILSKHKQPRAWVSVPAIPTIAQGKPSRRRLRELILEQYEVEDGPHPRLVPKPGMHFKAS